MSGSLFAYLPTAMDFAQRCSNWGLMFCSNRADEMVEGVRAILEAIRHSGRVEEAEGGDTIEVGLKGMSVQRTVQGGRADENQSQCYSTEYLQTVDCSQQCCDQGNGEVVFGPWDQQGRRQRCRPRDQREDEGSDQRFGSGNEECSRRHFFASNG